MKTRKYDLIQCDNTSCPECKEKVWLLSAPLPMSHLPGLVGPENIPSFYICFPCEYVGQVAVGKVEKMDGSYEEEDL